MIRQRFGLDHPFVEQHLHRIFYLLDFFGFGDAVARHQGEQVIPDSPHIGVDFFLLRTGQITEVLIHGDIGPANQ